MDTPIDDPEKVIRHWIDSAEQNYLTMQNLLKSQDYSWALFMGHLVLEKLLKAHYVRINKTHAFFTHDLLRISSRAGLELNVEHSDWLDNITTFNLNARYDNYKNDFYKLCTFDFTKIWVERIDILRLWLISKL
jgi:HEPN domain-containing protein